ncbi:collagenase [Lysobacter sp. F60174L2]|uniref:collagenase n=1 Tax=Lysobacter sp. F60174L2 TaxID=3459295 RepID=UPI00403DB4C9
MSSSSTRRARRLAAIGSVAAVATFLSYASQNNRPNLVAGPAATASTTFNGDQQGPERKQRRSTLLRRGDNPERRIARSQAVEKSPQTERQVFGHHIQQREHPASRRMPTQPPISQWVDTAYDHADPRINVLQRPSLESSVMMRGAATTAACNSTEFASLSGSALVAAVKSATTACINELFSLTGSTAGDTFNEAKMVTVATALASSANGYDGTNQDSTLQLVLFLRAGYYVQFYDSNVGDYGSALRNAIRPALDAFASNANFGLVNDTHGEILAEYLTLIDSSTENARYLYVVKRLLNAYDSRHDAYYWMRTATNNVYLILFRGHQNADFRQAVQADPSIVDTLYDFVNSHFSMMGTESDYLVSNAGRELGRFLQYSGSLKTLARSRSKALLDRSSVTGVTAPLWVGVGEMVDYYDNANCSYYNLCDFGEQVEAAALPIRHTCSPTLKIRAQAMSSVELAQTCQVVGGQESYFHDRLQTGGAPVADDYNAALEMVVFNSSTDYGTYAGAIFGIDTNNGGMYLEGNPAANGNQARFIAYEAEWMQPEKFEIWNLTHEYVHYLDGRFNMHGDFGDAISQDTIWWIEGLAEYMSYSYRDIAYTAAQQEAAKGTYDIGTIYANDYNSGQTRVYNWGYLAVRYMFENRHGQVDSILGYMRPGNYTGYAGFMGSIGSTNNTHFKGWLPCVADPATPTCGGTGNTSPVADFTSTTDGLTARFTDGSTDSDGRVVARVWDFGDGATSTAINATHVYASAGTYAVRLTVTDDAGATHSQQKNVTVSGGGTGLPECSGGAEALGKNCSRSNVSVRAGDYTYMYLYVPQGTRNLRITTQGGSGNADLYVNTLGSWASRDSHNYRSTNGGNSETVIVDYPPAGYVYVSLYGSTAASGVTVSTEY